MAGFAELELGIYRANESSYLLRCRFWQPDNTAESSLGLDSPAPLAFDLAALRDMQAVPEVYGQRLAAMLFAHPLARSALARARDVAQSYQVPLRLRLYIDPAAAELQALRWETLADLDRSVRLCADENVLFSRFISSGNLQSFTPSESPRLRAVVVIASPANLDPARFAPLDVPAERDRAGQALADMDVTYLAGGGQATPDRMVEALRSSAPLRQPAPDGGYCDVLYLVAHGWTSNGQARLLLEKPDGSGRVVLVDDLMASLGGLARKPLLAVLVSCQSAGTGLTGDDNVLLALGPRLAALGIPAVLAMHGSVTQQTIARFLPVFFRELRFDGQLDRALAVARAQVSDQPDWWMPVLFSRLRDNQLLKPSPLAREFTLLPFEPETVFIPGGQFRMGRDVASPVGAVAPVGSASPEGAVAPVGTASGLAVPAWEQPCHTVDLPPYRIGKYPVTNRQYAEFVRETGEPVNAEAGWDGQTYPPSREDHPMQGVTWYQALKYCAWLSSKTGRSYSLPTEAQWEKAARGTDGRLYPWGSDWQEGRSNPDPAQTVSVKQYPPQSPYGVCDLIGGLREWTISLWGERRGEPDFRYPWAEDGRNNPQAGPLVRRVFRGGVGETPEEVTCTTRGGFVPDKSGPPGKRHGFRVVLV